MSTTTTAGMPRRASSRSGSPSIVLASFLQTIMENLAISERRLDILAIQAVAVITHISAPKNTSSIKSKLIDDIMAPTITWKGFLKAMAVLKVRKLEVKFVVDIPENVTIDPKHLDHNGELRVGFAMDIPESFLVRAKDSNPGKALADTFRRLSSIFGYIGPAFDVRMTEHIRRSANRLSGKVTSDRRNNDKKELLSETHTFDVFIKGLFFLGIDSYVMEMVLTHNNGQSTFHSRRITLD